MHSSQLLFLSYQVTCILPNCCLYLTKLLPNFLIAVTILPSYFPTIVSILPSALHPYQQLFLSHLVTFILPNYCFCLTKLNILPNFFNLTKLHILPNYCFYLTKSLLNFLNIVTFLPSCFLISQLLFLSYQVPYILPKYCFPALSSCRGDRPPPLRKFMIWNETSRDERRNENIIELMTWYTRYNCFLILLFILIYDCKIKDRKCKN